MKNKRNSKWILALVAVVLCALYLLWPSGETRKDNYEVALVEKLEETDASNHELEEVERTFAITLKVLTGRFKEKRFETTIFHTANELYNLDIRSGDKVFVFIDEENGDITVGVDDFYKTNRLIAALVIFVIAVFIVTGFHGIKSLISLLITLVLVFKFLTMFLLKGYSPILLAVVVSSVVTLVTLLLVSGWNRKTWGAIVGTLGGVVSAGLFGYCSTTVMRLSGYTGHESIYLQNICSSLDFQGILVCGIIIGALGAVMDVTVSIASSLEEIKNANKGYGIRELFNSGIRIGRDIIGTMTNTLVLAYAGSSLTILLLFISQRSDFSLNRIINMDFICSEIVRAVAGSFGMVLAIPITALACSILYNRAREKEIE